MRDEDAVNQKANIVILLIGADDRLGKRWVVIPVSIIMCSESCNTNPSVGQCTVRTAKDLINFTDGLNHNN